MKTVEGAWSRRWVRIAGGPAFETQHAVWLQAGARYADVRVPFHPDAEAVCFSGSSGWDGDRFRWTHRIDLAARSLPADDIADLGWQGDVLLERGTFPAATGAVAYEEAWVRLPGSDGPSGALDTDDSASVRVGDHRITVIDQRRRGGRFAAVYSRRGETVLEVTA